MAGSFWMGVGCVKAAASTRSSCDRARKRHSARSRNIRSSGFPGRHRTSGRTVEAADRSDGRACSQPSSHPLQGERRRKGCVRNRDNLDQVSIRELRSIFVPDVLLV